MRKGGEKIIEEREEDKMRQKNKKLKRDKVEAKFKLKGDSQIYCLWKGDMGDRKTNCLD